MFRSQDAGAEELLIRKRTLLDGVRQFVPEEFSASRGPRRERPRSHHDVPAQRVRARPEQGCCARSLAVGMDSDGAEVVSEAVLELPTYRRVQRCAWPLRD